MENLELDAVGRLLLRVKDPNHIRTATSAAIRNLHEIDQKRATAPVPAFWDMQRKTAKRRYEQCLFVLEKRGMSLDDL